MNPDDLTGSADPTELQIFNPEPVPSTIPPSSAIKTRAASTAILASDPQKAIEDFQVMVAEAETGSNTTVQTLQKKAQENAHNVDMKAMTSILSDPSVPYEKKKAVVDNFNKNEFLKEPTVQLATNALSQASRGETADNEVARLTAADAIREIYETQKEVQGLVNAHVSSLSWKKKENIPGTIVAAVAPFSTQAYLSQVTSDLEKGKSTSLWDVLKTHLMPGSKKEDLRKKMELLPPAERAIFQKQLLESISKVEGVVLSSEKQFAQYGLVNDLLTDNDYSNTEKWLDNITTVLDAIGFGAFVRGSAKAAKTTKAATKTVDQGVDVGKAAEAATGPSKTAPTETVFGVRPQTFEEFQGGLVGQQDRMIQKLEDEKAGLLGEASNLAESGVIRGAQEEINSLRGQLIDEAGTKSLAKEIQKNQGVSYKTALSLAEKQVKERNASTTASIQRLEQTIETNRQAAGATQRIAAIEKEIEQLKAARAAVDSPGALTPIADLVRRIEIRSVTHTHNPSSPAAIIQQTNPEQARGLFEAVYKSDNDTVAEALYGTTKAEAIAGDVYPQALTETLTVMSKPVDIQRNLRHSMDVPQEIVDQAFASGALEYTQAEKAQARANKVNEFGSAEGLSMQENMGGFRVNGRMIDIDAVYGTPDGAFSNAQQAYDQALYALRGQGILPEEVTILKKQGLDHVPVKLEDVKDVEGNYLVRVQTSQEIDPTDITNWDVFDVKRNFLDRIPQLNRDNGSAARWIQDASSMLHPIYTAAATVASDKAAAFEKLLLSYASQFSDKYMGLKKAERIQIDQYIREANQRELTLDQTDLMARGFSADQIEAVRSWRQYWDGHFYLENLDLVRTLNGQGYQRLITPNADVFARPLESYQGVTKVYDPTLDMVITPATDGLKDLYERGGKVARLRRPTQFGDDTVEHIIVRNNGDEYLRQIRDTDQVLNYRNGYYQLQYTAPRFVDEIDANGIRRAVAVAGDTKEAEAFAARMRGTNPDSQYVVRADDRAMRTDSDDWFDINSASGRIAQRHRGKLLEDSTGMNLLGEGSYVKNPVESAIHAARSIAGRTINRPMLEAAKARFMEQYGRFLPSDGVGGKRFPSSSGELGAKGEQFTSELADARTTFEYIHYLENGYINGMDQVFKAGFMAIADLLGKKGYSKAERAALIASEATPTGLTKGTVFTAYIATNPLRQWIVQTHQGVRTFAYNPTGWATGRVEKLIGQYLGVKSEALGTLSKEAQEFTKFMDDSGLVAAVDKQNLVRGTLLTAADSTNPVMRAVTTPISFMRRIGFDLGETGNNLVHAAAVYDRYKSMGKNMLDPVVRDEAVSEIRAISYDMNHAGDMPYNQNSAGMVLQFMQVPHKAFLQATNRRLDRATRARLIAADVMLWGVPGAAAVSSVMGGDILPDNPTQREVVLYGMESMLFNDALRKLFKSDDINIDFSGLAPYDLTGWGEFFHAMLTGGTSQVIMNSPAGQLFFKEGGRTREAISSMARFFGMQEDIDETPQEAIAVINEVLKISSGWNNAVKAYLALETGKTYDKHGKLIDSKTHPVEAYLQAFGFPSANQRDLYQASKAAAEMSKAHKEEVLSVYKEVMRYYQTQLQSGNTDVKFITKVSSFALRKYKDDPTAQKIIQEQLMIDLQDRNTQVLSMMMRSVGLPDGASLKDNIRQMPVSDEQKQLLMQRIEDIEALRNMKGN
jgi:hypothetical protein